MYRESSVDEHAFEMFGHVELRDLRLLRRLVLMASRAAENPAGRISDVFRVPAERQGAYDFIENQRVKSKVVADALFVAAARRASSEDLTYVAVDGSSLSLTDTLGIKGTGAVGSTKNGGQGLKFINSLAFDSRGVLLGVLDQQWWARQAHWNRHDHDIRPVEEKETQHWLNSFKECSAKLSEHAPSATPWFLVDREGDNRHMLETLESLPGWFTIRSRSNRRLVSSHGKPKLWDRLHRTKTLDKYTIQVPRAHGRSARRAMMTLRARPVCLEIRDRMTWQKRKLKLFAVEAREIRPPRGQERILWRLLTNYPVRSACDAHLVVFGYIQRWKIEEFHKTWKTGACNVEMNQLRDVEHIIKWATIMAATATRIERLKHLGRNEPELPADVELGDYEIQALIMLKRRYKKRTETITDEMPTIGQATLWIAEVGGYTGKSSGGPPGSITIRRGLDDVVRAAELLKQLDQEGRLR